MGCCESNPDKSKDRSVGKELNHGRKQDLNIKKLLFLGSGGSGKSTLFKQLRMIHGDGFNANDKEQFIKHIHTQIINEMKLVIKIYIDYNLRKQQREKKEAQQNDNNGYLNPDDNGNEETDELLIYDDIELKSEEMKNMTEAQLVLNYQYDKSKHCLDEDICSAINKLWTEEAVIKEIYELRNITKIETSSAYFWNKLDEIQDSNYLPANEDILLCRLKTTGLHEQQFEMKGDTMHIIDVGGQRSQRRKWIHCFEYVVAVIFIASLSCYDEILEEDTQVNSMVDQIELFDNICNNHNLSQTAMIIFLNKRDLFRQKYCTNHIPLTQCEYFKDFQFNDEYDYKLATDYIINTFESMDRSQNKKIFTHLTSAIDTNNIEKVFGDVQEIIIANSLAEAGLIDE